MIQTKFLILFLFTQLATGQNICGDFNNYESSQEWIKELKEQPPDERKTKILKRIACEQKSEPNDISFRFIIVVDGAIISTSKEIPPERIEILQMIPADHYNISKSICEVDGIYPQKCNLGFVLIEGSENPLINQNVNLKNIRLKRKRGKITIKLVSDKRGEIALKVMDFFGENDSAKNQRIRINKGRNRIVVKTNNKLNLIRLDNAGLKTIILK